MANTKKTSSQAEEVMEMEVAEDVAKPTKKKVNKPTHDANELVPCRSVRFGELILLGPNTKMRYSWSNEGDVREVYYQDLVSWRALHSRYLFDPMIIIEDEDICEEWSADLGKLYEKVQEIDLKEMFKLPYRQFMAQLKKLPETMKSSVQNMAYAMVQNGTLYDLRVIKGIDETLGTELVMMI